MKVLVTGGIGFIGSHITDLLTSKDYEVVVVDNLVNSNFNNLKDNNSLKFSNTSVYDYKELNKIFKKENFDLVCHQAALMNTVESFEKTALYYKTNMQGTQNILKLSNKYNVKKVVMASSCSIYGDNCTLNTKEDTEKNPLSPYAYTKYTNEIDANFFKKEYNMNITCLRYSNVYGARQLPKDSVISNFIISILNNKCPVIHGSGKQTRDFIHVEDVARANLLALRNNTSNLSYNVGNNDIISINDLCNKILKLLNSNLSPSYINKRKGDISQVSLNNSLIKKDLGFKPEIDINEGLEKTIRYWKNV